MSYKVKIYVQFGYFEYNVDDMCAAMEHAQSITSSGVYRRSNSIGDVEFHRVIKVKVSGSGLESQYLDTFKRT